MKAIIPAAGMGTRLLPITKSQPKEMLPVLNKPAIQYVVEEASSSGFEQILIITSRGKKTMEDHFDRNVELERILEARGKTKELEEIRKIEGLGDIFYLRQKEQLGLGDAVLQAENYVDNEPFAVLLGDDIIVSEVPALKQLWDAYLKVKAPVVALEEVPIEHVERYGIVLPGKDLGGGLYKLDGVVEKPKRKDAPSRLAIMGRYIMDRDIFTWLKTSPKGVGGELQLTDSLANYIKTKGLYGLVIKGKRVDIGSIEDWLRANLMLALEDPVLRPRISKLFDQLRKDGRI
jgi:UTP--glucose-1-phosphate uridylyltransferase